jgi:hypothetical protein
MSSYVESINLTCSTGSPQMLLAPLSTQLPVDDLCINGRLIIQGLIKEICFFQLDRLALSLSLSLSLSLYIYIYIYLKLEASTEASQI